MIGQFALINFSETGAFHKELTTITSTNTKEVPTK